MSSVRSAFPGGISKPSIKEPLQDLRQFSLAELQTATENFSTSNILWQDGFGAAYRGRVASTGSNKTIDVAVKRLSPESFMGYEEWLQEITYLKTLNHRNVIKLVGYCLEGTKTPQYLTVHEFMPNKSLHSHLLETNGPVLEWNNRLRIALGLARGLAYLHDEMYPPIIYRDLKPANILLDEDFTPKLSDFSLARDGPVHGETHVSTLVKGTAGYIAPEYVRTGNLNTKCDVWSFGLILLVILTGKPAFDRNHGFLGEWVESFGSGVEAFEEMIDPRLNSNFSKDEEKVVFELAQRCIAMEPDLRPTMNKVVMSLMQVNLQTS